MIHSILIANRGEIACRIIRTCRRLGIRSIAVYSDIDKDAPFVQQADMAVALGGAQAADSYLNIDKILAAARRSQAQAIHPGYGFLSENAEFARRCAQAGFIFIGPNPEAIDAMGSKSKAKRLMQSQGVPTVPGYQGEQQDPEHLIAQAQTVGYPLLLKAVAGGGGKGMKIVHEASQLAAAIAAAKSEALNAFGDDALIIEKYFASARHIEFQIFGDKLGNVVHLFERECSLQRRYQKVMEESPSPVLSEQLRQTMGEAALNAARALHYDNAGTVEFILNAQGEFFFLEVNTRLQFEHPVTEQITGLDLVEWQILAAEGKPLPLTQSQIQSKGYALELRLYAENPNNQFLPETGTILHWHTPALEGIRYETGVQSGSKVDIYYDPMLAKIIAYAPSRAAAFRRMEYALSNMACLGLVSNQAFLLQLVRDEACINGDYDTHFLAQRFDFDKLKNIPTQAIQEAAIAATLHAHALRKQQTALLPQVKAGWRNNFYAAQKHSFTCLEQDIDIHYYCIDHQTFEVQVGEQKQRVLLIDYTNNSICLEMDGLRLAFVLATDEASYFVQNPMQPALQLKQKPRLPKAEQEKVQGGYLAQMPGEIRKILVKAGDKVQEGDVLLVLLSMKMENSILAQSNGTVEEVYVQEGDNVQAGLLLLKIV